MSPDPRSERPPVLVRLAPDTVDQLAQRVAELVGEQLSVPVSSQDRDGLLSASEVSEWWGVHRGWVYEHAAELGAIPIGTGPRPRLRFDPEQVARYLERRPASTRPAPALPSGIRARDVRR